VKARWSFCCTASPSSGSVGGDRASRWQRRVPRRRPRHPWLQPLIEPDGFESYAVDLLASDIRGLIGELGEESALLVGHDWGGSIAWATAMSHPEVVNRLAILNAAHPRRLSQGLRHPSQLRKSWYFFFFAVPGLPEEVVHARDWHFFRHFLEDANPPHTPDEIEHYVEAWSQPGAAAGMINYCLGITSTGLA
jgi:pimeloyl-ACP methyl ester carboxylesterase